jgi:cytochrome oxidase Cu insertion factor (SCO1/SenC/PrrC family)/mono/diheme cytochrome c family protein
MRIFSTALVAIFCLFAGIDAGFAAPPGSHWNKDYFGNPELITQDGKKVRFYDDLIKDKIVFIDFFFTHCVDICPLTTARTARLADKLEGHLGKDVWILSISLDPVRDTPEMVKMFAEGYQVRPGWIFLTSDDPLGLKELRFRLGERSRKLSEHFAYALLGNEKTGDWQKSSVMTEVNLLTEEVLRMDPVYRDRPYQKKEGEVDNSIMQNRYYNMGDMHPGQALFRRACASCHTIGKGDVIGPDLRGANERRTHDWLVSFITRPDLAIQNKDPIAMELKERYNNVNMPFLGVTAEDAKDLIDYIRVKTEYAEKADKKKAEDAAGGATAPQPAATDGKKSTERAANPEEKAKRTD